MPNNNIYELIFNLILSTIILIVSLVGKKSYMSRIDKNKMKEESFIKRITIYWKCYLLNYFIFCSSLGGIFMIIAIIQWLLL